MRASLKVKEADGPLTRKALESIRTGLNVAFHQAAGGVARRVRGVCRSLIEGTDEYKSLLGGRLLGELGIPDVSPRLHAILAAIEAAVDVSVVPVRVAGSRLAGGMVVGLLRADLGPLLSLPEASYVSAPSGETIRWLDWLLTQGDRIIVAGYDAFFDLSPPERGRSRTGLALMRRGEGWGVPAEFAGTESDNFLTRAFDVAGVEALLARILREEIEARL